MRKHWIVGLVIVGALVGGLAVVRPGRRAGTSPQRAGQAPVVYFCPMHPDFTSDKPGDCPICHMRLVRRDEAEAQPGGPRLRACILHNCPMTNCPMELKAEPGKEVSCPVCGTHVVEAAEMPARQPLYYRHPHRPEITSPQPRKDEMGMDYVPVYEEKGGGGINVSESKRQLIGMKSAPIGERSLTLTVRASGRVAYDPELYNAIAEYREAAKALQGVRESPYPDVKERALALLNASRLRLRQSGFSEEQIDEYARSSEAPTNLIVGQGSSVWVYAQIFEHEIGLIKPGQTAAVKTPAYPGRIFPGVVRAIDPIVSPETRSLRARLEVPDPKKELKLEMFVEVEIHASFGRRLAVPEEAVLQTGTRSLVFADLGQGRIEPREVTLGREADGYYEVLSGLAKGDKVVTSANFLIDSESKLKSAIEGKKQAEPAPSGHEGHAR